MKVSLIHGLGATSGVWHNTQLALRDAGIESTVEVMLAGHGAAEVPWPASYTLGEMAAHATTMFSPNEEVILVGHSLGGAIALALATDWFRPRVRGVVAVGIKCVWSDDDVVGMAKVAAKGIRWFDSEEEATDRFLLQAGLKGLVEPGAPAAALGVVEGGTHLDELQRGKAGSDEVGRWRVAQDPRTFAQQKLDMPGLLAAVQCPVILGAGATDPMVTEADLAALVPDPRIAPGVGHNVHVESPEWVATLVAELL